MFRGESGDSAEPLLGFPVYACGTLHANPKGCQTTHEKTLRFAPARNPRSGSSSPARRARMNRRRLPKAQPVMVTARKRRFRSRLSHSNAAPSSRLCVFPPPSRPNATSRSWPRPSGGSSNSRSKRAMPFAPDRCSFVSRTTLSGAPSTRPRSSSARRHASSNGRRAFLNKTWSASSFTTMPRWSSTRPGSLSRTPGAISPTPRSERRFPASSPSAWSTWAIT